MSYAFHASASPGQWINDPNALFFADGRYQLHVQHAADAPGFKALGWGRFSSPDLQDWRWEGVAIPPDGAGSAYSGSVAGGRAFLTRRLDGREPREVQVSRPLAGGADSAPFGPAGRNARDPFVWQGPSGWRMLVARPCDWTDWRGDPPSTLELWGSPDGEGWAFLRRIGPWSPPGVMWEVPALIDFGDVQALILSLVDRRRDAAECEVRYWLGRLDDAGFRPAPGFPAGGALLDHGPDFYAAIPNSRAGWPTPDRVLVGWASSWRTARLIPWPEARGGGPIAMPRRVGLAGDRLVLGPAVDRPPDQVAHLSEGGRLSLVRGRALLQVEVAGDRVTVGRRVPGLPDFERGAPAPAGGGEVLIFTDGPLVELFWRGTTITAVLPGEGGFSSG